MGFQISMTTTTTNPEKYDLIVYGATGFTGMRIVQEITAFPPLKNLRWIIAGRDAKKLDLLVSTLDFSSVSRPAVMVADVKDAASLESCIGKARVCISCVGPFRLFGEPVVQACIKTATDYVDICGETEFIEKMYANYNQQAIAQEIAIIPACGYDCVPADLGTLYTKMQFEKSNATASAIEMFVKFNSGKAGIAGNATTFISAILGFASVSELRAIRKKSHRSVPYVGQPLKLSKGPRWEPRQAAWAIPASVADVPIVKLGQQMVENHIDTYKAGYRCGSYKPRQLAPVYFAGYFCFASYLSVLYFSYLGFILSLGARFQWFRNWMISHPDMASLGIFKSNGPSQKQLNESSFAMTFIGRGTTQQGSNLEIRTTVKGPEMGYVATPILVAGCASMLLDREVRKYVPHGVLTPAAAFNCAAETIIRKLDSRGVHFAVSSKLE